MSEELGVDSLQLELAMCQSWIRLAMFVFLRMFCMFQSSRMASCRLRSSQSKGGHQPFTKAAVQYRTATLVFIVLLQMDYAGGFKRPPQKLALLSHQPPSRKSPSMTGTNGLDMLAKTR